MLVGEFKLSAMVAILDMVTENYLSNSKSPCYPDAPAMFQLNLTYGLGGDVV